MATTVVTLTGDEAGLLRSLRNVIEKEREHERQLHETAAAGTQSADEIRRAMDQLAASNNDVMEGLLADLRRTGPEGKKVAAELRQDLVAAGTLAGQSMDDIVAKLREIDPAAAEAADAIRTKIANSADGGKEKFKSFGVSAIKQVAGIAASYIGVQEAIQLVVEANRKVIETNKQIFEGLKINQSGDRRLLQVSESAEDFDRLRKKADDLATRFGIDRQESRNLVFSARSEGFEGSLDFIAANNQQIAIESQAGVAGQLPTLFASAGLSPEQAINATLAAAQQSRLSFEDIGRAIPTAAEGASLTGASPAETAGSLAVLASRFKSADTAADRLKALAIKFDLDNEFGLADQGLIGGVERLQSLSPEDQRSFLGESIELNTAFKIFSEELEKIKQFTQSTQQAIDATGTAASPTGIGRQIAGTDATLSALRNVAIAENTLEVERERRRAAGEGDRQTGIAEALTFAERQGNSDLTIATAEMVGDRLEGFGVDRETSIRATTTTADVAAAGGDVDSVVGTYIISGFRDLLLPVFNRIADNTEPAAPNPNAAMTAAAAASDARAAQ